MVIGVIGVKNKWLSEIRTHEDLPEPLATIAKLVGVENAIMLTDKLGGGRIYLPRLSTLRRHVRDRKIQNDFTTGYNIRELAQKNRLSEQSIYKILKKARLIRQKSLKKHSEHEQLKLF